MSEMLATELLAKAERRERNRAEAMPTETDALLSMMEAYTRLLDLGWRNAIYSPKDGSVFLAIEVGCTKPHRCHYRGEWPKGRWWVEDGGDLWPARPVLFKPLPEGER